LIVYIVKFIGKEKMFEDGKYKEYLARPTLGFLVNKKLGDNKTKC
jgi:hypothetical protein